jgi:hypothetical protein
MASSGARRVPREIGDAMIARRKSGARETPAIVWCPRGVLVGAPVSSEAAPVAP